MIKKIIYKFYEIYRLQQKFGLEQSLHIVSQLVKKQPINIIYCGESFSVNPEKGAIYHLLNSVDKIRKMVNIIPLTTCNTMLDIGANCGLFSLYFSKRFPNANIFAFEPSDMLQEIIVSNLESRSIHIVKMAVSNFNGETEFFTSKVSEQTNSLFKKNVELFACEDEVLTQKVQTTTLDSFIKKEGIQYVDVIKIDIQGAEYLVMQCAEQTISLANYLIVEISFLDDHVFELITKIRTHFPHYMAINPVLYGADIIFSKKPFDCLEEY